MLYAAADYFPKIAFCCCYSAQTFTASPVQFLMCKQVVLQKFSYKLSVQCYTPNLTSGRDSFYLYPHIKFLSTAIHLPPHSSNHCSVTKCKTVFPQEMYSELHFWDVRHISWPTGNSPQRQNWGFSQTATVAVWIHPSFKAFDSSPIRKPFMMKSLSPRSSCKWQHPSSEV